MTSHFDAPNTPADSSGTSAPGQYQKILFRLKHLRRPVGTWMEAFRERKLPIIGDLLKIPEHLRRLPGINAFETNAIVTGVSGSSDLLVIYMAVQPRHAR